MKYQIKQMNIEEAKTIAKWKYDTSYSIYSMEDNEETIAELQNGSYYSTLDSEGRLMGYFCFFESAQVPIGRQFGVYEGSEIIDIGLGLDPNLCGRGLGFEFMHEGMEFAKGLFGIKNFRLTVASFNKRAIKVYERLGFKKLTDFIRESDKGNIKFDVMLCLDKSQMLYGTSNPAKLLHMYSVKYFT